MSSPSDFSNHRVTKNMQQGEKSRLQEEQERKREREQERKRGREQEQLHENKECKEKLFGNVIYKTLGRGVYGEVSECGPRSEKRVTRSSRKIYKPDDEEPDDEEPDDKNQCQRFALKKIAKKRTIENKEYEYQKRFWIDEYGTLNYLHDRIGIKSVPNVYDYWECPEYYYIKMQLLSNITLNEILTELESGGIDIVQEKSNKDVIDELLTFIKEVIKMNKNNIYNNDLHSNNILWDTTTKKFYMIDFGMTTFGEYYQHDNNRDIVNDENKQYADVVFVLAQLGEDIKNFILEQLPINIKNVLQGGGKSIQGGFYKKRIIRRNKKTPKKKTYMKKTYMKKTPMKKTFKKGNKMN